MSFEKKMKKRGHQKLDAFAKNPYHQEPTIETTSVRRDMPLWSKILIPVGSVAVAVFGTFLGMRMVFSSGNRTTHSKDDMESSISPASEPQNSQAQGASSYAPDNSQGTYIKRWDEKTIIEKYPSFNYEINGTKSLYYWYHNDPILEEHIDTKLAEDYLITGHDIYEDKDYETTISIYTVKDFASRLILAAKFNEDNNYYCFGSNAIFNPYTSLGELLIDIPLDKVASFNEGFHGYTEEEKRVSDKYNGVSKEFMVDFINKNSEAKNPSTTSELDDAIKTYNQYNHVISIPTPFPTINIISGTGASGLTFYDNGFLMATMLNKNYLFYIGIDSYQELEDYLKNNLVGNREGSYHPFSVPVY